MMINKKEFLRFSKVTFLFIMLVLLIKVMPLTYSRYETDATSDVKADIAFYLLKTDYVISTIKIPHLVPSDTPYIYKFTIANNDGTNRLETRLKYDLSIKTTTNLPLSYSLYMNEEYTSSSAINIIVDDIVSQDEYGTYFKVMKTNTNYFSYLYDEVNTYTLVINFPKRYNTADYQDLVENIEINIDSKQILSGDI